MSRGRRSTTGRSAGPRTRTSAQDAEGVYYPGDESEEHYFYNPGEGFAEAYRLLNERKLGLSEAPWDIVTNALYPDDNALTLLEQDVTAPWTKNTALTRSGSVSASAKSRAFVISTPLDGRLTVRLTSSAAKAKFRLDVLSPNAKSIAGASGKNKTVLDHDLRRARAAGASEPRQRRGRLQAVDLPSLTSS